MLGLLARDGTSAQSIDLRPPGTVASYPYLETIQARLSEGGLMARAWAQADIVVCRYRARGAQ
jgi:hypothetical protein